MGLDANLCKYRIPKISKIDREYHLDWREHYYGYVFNEDKDKWKEFNTEVFYTSDGMLNRIIMNSIKQTTGDDYSEEGASLFNLDSLKLVIEKLEQAIESGKYNEYEILIKQTYEDELKKLLGFLDNELVDLLNGEYTYIYHATY